MGGLAPIHNGHITVHQNQLIVTPQPFVLCNIAFNYVQSLFSVPGYIANLLSVDFAMMLENYFEGIDVELFVIDQKDSHWLPLSILEIRIQVGLVCRVDLPRSMILAFFYEFGLIRYGIVIYRKVRYLF